jgi:hypothetical protein
MAWARKQRSGRWTGHYRNPAGGIESVGSFVRKRDAESAAEKQEHRVELGNWTDPELARTLFGDYAAHYMAVTLNQDASTKTRDASLLLNHLLPAFGSRMLREVTTPDVRELIAHL